MTSNRTDARAEVIILMSEYMVLKFHPSNHLPTNSSTRSHSRHKTLAFLYLSKNYTIKLKIQLPISTERTNQRISTKMR